mmetsp:Transcript_24575/g.73685  ORF Transcript_24575/g.73685 Transcript_24575/m.73685 type:complete len:87 (-) Transcript_24575:286-546(-)
MKTWLICVVKVAQSGFSYESITELVLYNFWPCLNADFNSAAPLSAPTRVKLKYSYIQLSVFVIIQEYLYVSPLAPSSCPQTLPTST